MYLVSAALDSFTWSTPLLQISLWSALAELTLSVLKVQRLREICDEFWRCLHSLLIDGVR